MSQTRQPAVAGLFYPADSDTLRHDIANYLDHAAPHNLQPRALIVPHAGYIYSGPIAATAYRLLAPLKDQIKKVALLGPSHRVAFSGLAVPQADIFRTPLGDIPIDQSSCQSLTELPQVICSDQAHRDEHSLEVQLPFLQQLLGDFKLIPLVVGDADRNEVAEVINQLWDNDTLVVISTDLSHYHPYAEAQHMDRATSEAIVNLQPDRISYEGACGRNGLKGMLSVARDKHLRIDMLDLRNSGDTAGDKDRVVGYGAYVVH